MENKVMNTVEQFLNHELQQHYGRVIVSLILACKIIVLNEDTLVASLYQSDILISTPNISLTCSFPKSIYHASIFKGSPALSFTGYNRCSIFPTHHLHSSANNIIKRMEANPCIKPVDLPHGAQLTKHEAFPCTDKETYLFGQLACHGPCPLEEQQLAVRDTPPATPPATRDLQILKTAWLVGLISSLASFASSARFTIFSTADSPAFTSSEAIKDKGEKKRRSDLANKRSNYPENLNTRIKPNRPHYDLESRLLDTIDRRLGNLSKHLHFFLQAFHTLSL
nr:hypothetical protein BHM03_00013995 [Ipomoea batatas]